MNDIMLVGAAVAPSAKAASHLHPRVGMLMNRRKTSSDSRFFETPHRPFWSSSWRPVMTGLLSWLFFTIICSLLLMLQHKNAPVYDEGYAPPVDPNPPGLW